MKHLMVQLVVTNPGDMCTITCEQRSKVCSPHSTTVFSLNKSFFLSFLTERSSRRHCRVNRMCTDWLSLMWPQRYTCIEFIHVRQCRCCWTEQQGKWMECPVRGLLCVSGDDNLFQTLSSSSVIVWHSVLLKANTDTWLSLSSVNYGLWQLNIDLVVVHVCSQFSLDTVRVPYQYTIC